MSTLTELFSNIANAIRSKKGTTGKIKASDFASEIENLSVNSGDNNAKIATEALTTNTQTGSSSYVLNQLIETLPSINTSGWTSTAYLFYKCSLLKNIPIIDTSNVINMNSMFSTCNSLTQIDLNWLDASKATNMSALFNNCINLEEVNMSKVDISKVTNLSSMFNNCSNLKTVNWGAFNTSAVVNISQLVSYTQIKQIPKLKGDSINNITSAFAGCSYLESFEGFENLGKAYTQKTKNYSPYTFSLASSTLLTLQDFINIINNLYDLNLTYDVANGGTLYSQSFRVGSGNMNKLTDEIIAIANAKGWNITT